MSNSSAESDLAQQMNFWRDQIANRPGRFELPTDHPRLPAPSFFKERTGVRLRGERWARIVALARGTGADPFSLVLAAFALVGTRQTAQDDLWLGTAGVARIGDGKVIPNLLALRLRVPRHGTVREFIAHVHAAVEMAMANRDVPFSAVATLVEDARPLFRVLVLPAGLQPQPREEAETIDFDQLGADAAQCDVILKVTPSESGVELDAQYDPELFRADTIERLLGQVDVVLAAMADGVEEPLSTVRVVTEAERQLLALNWNRTAAAYDRDACIHHLIEQQVARTPHLVALVSADSEWTYAELNARANRLAHLLIAKGVGPDVAVGVCIERSPAMVMTVLAIHKAGGAYVPMDPGIRSEHLAYIVEDSGLRLVLADSGVLEGICAVEVVRIDRTPDANESDANPLRQVPAQCLAYIAYTADSAGYPVGVMVEHRNVVNFFTGMDQQLGTRAGVWLAVTNLSSDTSVLELFWTLTHGYKVVLQSGSGVLGDVPVGRGKPHQALNFGLFYFASDEGDYAHARGRDKYKLLLESARFADDHGFCAVWTPERHFHTFGGMFPSPAVTAGALAMITKRIGIRAGSVVLPLHNPIRVTEEWSLLDNLSDGRVSISFASGWQPQDFVIAPEAYADRHARMFEGIETIRALWRGEVRHGVGGDGQPVTFTTRPRPVQPELPVWVTAGGSRETFRRAGEIGANVLTHLLQQGIEQLSECLETYRQAWKKHGHEGDGGQVALMLHTFVSDDLAHVRATVHEPFKSYLKGSVGLFAAVGPTGLDAVTPSPADLDALAEHAFERYFESGGLFGTPESCLPLVIRLKKIGVTEVACLIDFGIPTDTVLASLPYLDDLRQRCATAVTSREQSVEALIRSCGVTHLQCPPSMARMLAGDPKTAPALATLEHVLVGGEILSDAFAEQLRQALPKGTLTSMYGSTETTIWSLTQKVGSGTGSVALGRPIANTQVYVLDSALNPVPIGGTGDLYIGGDGVARGYVKRPELTRERFIRDPFHDEQRLYRTGHLVRRRTDGALDFRGRSDHQVNLGGYRIELEEIERCLTDHPDVGQAAVDVDTPVGAVSRLIAYVVARRIGATVNVARVRQHLRRHLPDFMVPREFVVLDRLPLTPAGKLDRHVLRGPNSTTRTEAIFVAPNTATEQALATLWREILRVDRVGRDDSFFESGGHSLLAMQLVRRIRDHFSVDCSLQDVFRRPHLAELAANIDRASSTAAAQEEIATGTLVDGFEYGEV
jgi:natural product biosynthesis luciferase-like monooxygenase protein